jgi:hypothetical protein
MKTYHLKSSGDLEEVKQSYNFLAFFFGFLWYLFGGMFGKAVIIFLGSVIIVTYFGTWGLFLFSIYLGAVANKHREKYLRSKGYKIVPKKQAEKIRIVESKKREKEDINNSKNFFKIVPWIIFAIVLLVLLKILF